MKQRIVNFILKFLGLDQRLILIDQNLEKSISQVHQHISDYQRSVDYELDRIGRCFNIGVDVCPLSKDSWAIVCTVDKHDQAVLRFIDLKGADMKRIEEFLYQSTPRTSHRYIDSPRRHPIFWRKG